MNNVIDIRTRKPVVWPHLVQPDDDVRVTFARLVERMADEMERREYDPRPTDGEV